MERAVRSSYNWGEILRYLFGAFILVERYRGSYLELL